MGIAVYYHKVSCLELDVEAIVRVAMLTTEGGAAAVKPSESNYDCALWLQLSEILVGDCSETYFTC
jgi:hypothetical protein